MGIDQINPSTATDCGTFRVREPHRETSLAADLARLAELMGVPVVCYDLRLGRIVDQTNECLLPVLPAELLWNCVQTGEPGIVSMSSGLVCFAMPLPGSDPATHVAVGYLLSNPGLRPADLVLAAAERGWSQSELDGWLATLPHCDPAILRRHVTLASEELLLATDSHGRSRRQFADRRAVGEQLRRN